MSDSGELLTTSKAKVGVNLSFSSASEIESFVHGSLGNPVNATSSPYSRKAFEGTWINASGVDIS